MSPEKLRHTRIIYGILDLFGDLGGVFEFVIVIFVFFIEPFSRFDFMKQATEKMFLAEIEKEDEIRNKIG